MRSPNRLLTSALALVSGSALTAGAFVATFASLPRSASAQELPRVMLVVDGSGNMARQPDGTECSDPDKTRWAMVVEALTGKINQYKCKGGDDATHPNVLWSDKCTWQSTGGVLISAPQGWLRVGNKQPLAPQGPGCNGNNHSWDQDQDGLLDLFSSSIRFGLMISDANRDPATDATGGYSYFLGGAANGRYPDMTTPASPATVAWEVGGRNDSAPADAGRLMGFGANASTPTQVAQQNDHIQKVILAFNPVYNDAAPGDGSIGNYTPVAAMLKDARDFMVSDTGRTIDGTDSAGTAFEQTPPAGCGSKSIILVSPGDFGGEMRGGAANDGGLASPTWVYGSGGQPCTATQTEGYLNTAPAAADTCPYQDGPTIVNQLKNSDGIPVTVVGVVDTTVTFPWAPQGSIWSAYPGFGGWRSCTSLNSDDYDDEGWHWWGYANGSGGGPGICNPAYPGYAELTQCCNLMNLVLPEVPASQPGPLYIISDISGLKDALSTIAAGVNLPPTGQTIPAEAVAAPNILLGGTTDNPTEIVNLNPAVPSAFEVLSTLKVPLDSSGSTTGEPWIGTLERRRLTCDATGNTPRGASINAAKGDDYAKNLNSITNRNQRKLLLNLIDYTNTTSGYTASDTLRPCVAGGCISKPDLKDGLGDTGTVMKAPLFTDSATITTNGGSAKIYGPDLGLIGGGASQNFFSNDLKVCNKLVGASDIDRCARRTLRWLTSWNGRSTDRIDHTTGGRALLGGFYHSSPIMVGPPLDYVRDEAYRGLFSQKASTPANPTGQATRPTVTYGQTTDGQLHAFITANNSGTSDYAYPTTNLLSVKSLTTNELWSFIPPAVLPKLYPSIGVQTVFLDGPIVSADVLQFRDAATAISGGGAWSTVLIGSGGASSLGGFYYALDITDPTKPKFLWQLKSGGNDRADLFGSNTPAAAIATVGIQNGVSVDQVGIAILAGGSGPAPSGGLWSATDPIAARSVTIVRLDTGEILKRFEGGAINTPVDIDTLDPSVLVPAVGPARRDAANPLLAPMSGTPVVFPGTPGVNARRAYVGDAGGRIWRIDLSDTNPNNWKIDMALDTFSIDSERQPVVVSPVVSADPVTGAAILVYATGQQSAFDTPQPGVKNYLVRFRDDFAAGAFAATELGREPFNDGERVSGPIQLFDSTLYFTTYAPIIAGCGAGTAKIWGIDYLTGAAAGVDLNGDGTPDGKSVPVGGSVIFGAQLTRVPGCFATNTSNSGADSWLAGNYSTQTKTTTAQYQISFNGGSSTSGVTNWSNQGSATTNNLHVQVKTPKALLKIHSWATVSE